MEESTIPNPAYDHIRRSYEVYLPTLEEALSKMPNLMTAFCDGNSVWSRAQNWNVEDNGTAEVPIKFKIRSDAL
jgi:hypothetical protein